MPNPKILSDLLKAAGKLPKGSPAAKEAVAAKIAAEEAEQAARYAPHTPPTETGRKALAKAKRTLKPEEPPAVVIPSKLSNIERAIRESKGEYGARRVQRAADEIPNLESLYAEKALREAFGGDNAKALMVMKPEDFERYSAPLDARFTDDTSTRYTSTGQRIGYREYIEDYLPNVGKFDDVPYLQINKEEQGLPLIPFISGHEGRHRSRVLASKGQPSGLVQLLPRAELREPFPRRSQEEYLEALIRELGMTDDLVLPESYMAPSESTFDKKIQRPAIKLPKVFASGGLAMATGGQAFPLQEEFQAEVERRAARPRTRAGVPVEDTNVLGGALQGLGETLVGGGRGALATMLGAPADILNLLNVKQFGTPDIPYGSEFFKESLPLAPTTQTGKTAQQLGEFLPINPEQPVQAGVAGARRAGKALAPTMADMLEAQLQKTGMMMPIAPEGKAAKIKAPANDLGFYNPAEKAALNLQRKKGTGDAFLADMKKQPGVNDERLTELGLDQFKGRPNVTREEIIAATEERRIPLQESVKRERDEARIEELEREYDDLIDAHSEATVTGDVRARERYEREMADNFEEQKALKSVEEARYGPSSHPDYVMPGGTDYREIRVSIPEQKAALPSMEGFTVETVKENKFTGQRDILIRDPKGNIVTNRYGFRGDDEQALLDEAKSLVRDKGKEDNFYHTAHHGNEPNVLLHLRVANHVDADGKKGLLIDELQSDWHQQGAKKGYKGKDLTPDQIEIKFVEPNVPSGHDPSLYPGYYESFDKNTGRLIGRHSGTTKPDEAMKEALYVANQMKTGVPDAPFKSNWYQLGLKRAIKEAADTGMDRVYLTTGARQADRYDLSKQVGLLSGMKQPNGEFLVYIEGKDGSPLFRNQGGFSENGQKLMTEDELSNTVGKEAAKKIIEGKPNKEGWVDLRDDALKVGGEGMKQWYDKTYKNYLEKYAKQHGGKLGVTHLKTKEDWPFPIQISSDGEKYWISGRDPRIDANNPNLAGKKFDSWDEANKAREAFYSGHDEPVYYIDITDAMRESAKKGQSYKDGGAVHPAVEKFAASLPHPAVTEFVAKLADGGGVWKAMVDGKYNTVPDTSDAERIIQGPAFAEGGGVWKQLVEGAGNA